VRGTAMPATFASTCGSGTGYTQGVPVDTSRVNEAATLASMASGVGTITNPGDVPVAAVLTIQGAAIAVYYLATAATGRRVPISTDAAGVGRLDERAGLYLAPGVNRITAYSAATGTTTLTSITVMSFFGTAWQFSGNQAAGTATRMDLGPALTVNRTGSATYSDGALIQTALDDVPRIGWSWINRRNLIAPSQDLFNASWSSSNITRVGGGAVEPFGFSGSGAVATLTDTSSGATQNSQISIGALAAISYVASVYILKDGNTTRQAGFTINTSTQFAGALLNTSTGVAQRSTDSTLTSTVSVTDAGLWWRLAMTWTGDATANNWRITPAIATAAGTATSAAATGSAVFACPQVEIGTAPTAYQATDASGIALDHPANDGGLVLEGSATNLCLQSEAFNTTWTIPAGAAVTANTAASPDGLTTADTLSYTSSAPAAEQTITVAASTSYTFACWVRAVSGAVTAIVEWENASTTVNYAQTTATVGTTWTRIAATGTTPAGVTSVKVRVRESTTNSIYVWGAQMEAGTAATSYIPTTTASVTRNGELAGIVSPHNLLTYSDQFDNAAWVKGSRITVTANAEIGPDGIQNADRVVLAAGLGTASFDDLRLSVAANTYEIGKVYTLSCWVKTITGSPASMRLFLNGAGPTPLTFVPTTTWQRYSATYIPTSAASDGWTIDFNNEGYLPGRYVRTTDTQVLPTTMIDPSWSQNGYIETDIIWPSRTVTGNSYNFGDGIVTTAGTLILTTDLSGTTIRFARYDSTATRRDASVTNATVYNAGTARVRMEWTNYQIGGSRYMYLRLYLNGSLQIETNYAGQAGSSWPSVDVTRLARLRSVSGDQGTVSNIVLGTPVLPEGARAAGI
jgi:hypothetical protein